ncbi:Hint domain-containing protein, partial [Pseudovibrio ascidiaceicola]|uniref:Hint domain-containing protein n=1 Tax=Pseudovibrio ascidiaceicola TaxID=285279 RepID=UPI003D36EF9E
MPTIHEIINPVTGETVSYTNPWSYDTSKDAWVADDINFVKGDDFNNLLRFGQPFDPSNHFTGRFYRHDLVENTPELGPTVIFSQENVITHGYGSNISFDDFKLVKDFNSGKYSKKLQEGTTYTLSDLQSIGISPPDIKSNGQDYGDHALSTDLYGTGDPYPGSDRPLEMAYIFGSVRYEISPDTTFKIVDGKLVIDGHIRLTEDNFNHTGGVPDLLSAVVQVGAGDHSNFERVLIQYEGEGASRRIVKTIEQKDFCFLAGTPISMWDGTKKPIEDIRPDDIVTSYDENGNLVPGRVKRTKTNRAKHILDFHGLMVTPGHAIYCADGKFKGQHVPIIDILRSDGAIQKEDGTI